MELLTTYRPKLYYQKVVWKATASGGVIYNIDGASRGNLGPCAYGYIIRNEAWNILYAETQCFGLQIT